MFGRQALPSVRSADVSADAFLLDVREEDEFRAGHAPGAVHVPMMQVPGRLDEIPTDRDVVVACRVGGRSAQVVAYLRAQGRDNVRNLTDGMLGWAASGRPLITEDGSAPGIL
ncbi:MAG TPA: rhodanese-like domain-containing protein [Micromonosporaceae bacterium]